MCVPAEFLRLVPVPCKIVSCDVYGVLPVSAMQDLEQVPVCVKKIAD